MTTSQKMIIAIDGPAASGKGTLTRALADKLNLASLDTGALYRAVAFMMLADGVSLEDAQGAEITAKKLRDTIGREPAYLSNPALRRDEIGQAASQIAAFPSVRAALIDLQQGFAQNPPADKNGAILDGRDIGSVICPRADVKIYIIANAECRAERRSKELQLKGVDVTYEAVLEEMVSRDARDSGRDAAPMAPADDAIIIDTSDMTAQDVLEKALSVIAEKTGLVSKQ